MVVASALNALSRLAEIALHSHTALLEISTKIAVRSILSPALRNPAFWPIPNTTLSALLSPRSNPSLGHHFSSSPLHSQPLFSLLHAHHPPPTKPPHLVLYHIIVLPSPPLPSSCPSQPLLAHPNSWVRHGALGFFDAITPHFTAAEVFSLLRPTLRPFLCRPLVSLSTPDLSHSLKAPVSRMAFDQVWAGTRRGAWRTRGGYGRAG